MYYSVAANCFNFECRQNTVNLVRASTAVGQSRQHSPTCWWCRHQSAGPRSWPGCDAGLPADDETAHRHRRPWLFLPDAAATCGPTATYLQRIAYCRPHASYHQGGLLQRSVQRSDVRCLASASSTECCCAVCLITGTRLNKQVTLVLRDTLHWLSITQHVEYKIAWMTYSCVCGTSLAIFHNICHPVASVEGCVCWGQLRTRWALHERKVLWSTQFSCCCTICLAQCTKHMQTDDISREQFVQSWTIRSRTKDVFVCAGLQAYLSYVPMRTFKRCFTSGFTYLASLPC